jgi:hypothetical protein
MLQTKYPFFTFIRTRAVGIWSDEVILEEASKKIDSESRWQFYNENCRSVSALSQYIKGQ